MSRDISRLCSATVRTLDLNRAFDHWNGEEKAWPKLSHGLLNATASGDNGIPHFVPLVFDDD
jgi:hypothetical protein